MQFVSHIQDFLPIQLGLRVLLGTSIAISATTAAVANPASIDTSFADDGWLVLPNSASGVDGLVRLDDSNDRFLAVTRSHNPIQISAYDGDGNPVLSFGNAGVLESTNSIGVFVDLIRMPDNTFRLVGRERMLAFNASGVALAGFNGDGQLSFDKPITAAAVNQGALFLARGAVDAATSAPLIEVEKRSASTGALDSTFGVGGIANMRSFASNFDAARFIRIDSSRRPVVFGHIGADRQLTVARMTVTGAADTSFGPDGNGLTRDTSGRRRLVDDFEIVHGRLIGSGRFGAGIYEALSDGSGFEARVVNTQIGTCNPRDMVPLAGGGLLSVGYDESVADGADSQICILSIDNNFSIDNDFTSYSANASGADPSYDYFGEDEEAMSALVLPSGRIVIGAARRAASDMHFSSTGPGKILMLTGPAPDYGADPDNLPTHPMPSPNPTPATEPGTPGTPTAESSGSGALPLWVLLLGVLLSSRKYRTPPKSPTLLMICSAILIPTLTGCATKTTTQSGEEIEAKSFVIDFDTYAYKAR